MNAKRVLALAVLCAALPGVAWAYPEFQGYVKEHSGRNVNCALCHSHPDGPEGLKPGQIGSFDAAAMERLGKARAAFEPGQEVHSPILNEFGNDIIRQLGKQRFLQLRQEPGKLAESLDQASDLDSDGIPDATEYLAGTLVTDATHGDPWTLFHINLRRYWFPILMSALATAAGLYGLNNFVRGFEALAGAGHGATKD